MQHRDSIHVIAVRCADHEMRAWAASARDAEMLAEALYEAHPDWHIRINGSNAVFSREGKVIDFANPSR